MFWSAVLNQGTATPVAEFQSQVPVFLASDPLATDFHISLGTTLWHAGILASVLVCGFLFDRASTLQRILVVGAPMLLNASLFAWISSGESIAIETKLALTFALGATFAPSNYLVMTTYVNGHVPAHLMPTVSSIIDLAGYVGNILLLQLQSSDGDAISSVMGSLAGSAAISFVASSSLYFVEHRRQLHNKKQI